MKNTSNRSGKQENQDIACWLHTLEKNSPQSRIGMLQHLCVQACEGQDAEGIGSCTHSDQSQIASPEIFGADLRFQQHLAWMATPQAPSKLDTKVPLPGPSGCAVPAPCSCVGGRRRNLKPGPAPTQISLANFAQLSSRFQLCYLEQLTKC